MSEKWITVAGTDMGLSKYHVFLTNEKGVDKPVKILGRWFYIKKCRKDEMQDGIVIPEASQQDTVFGLVMAIGTRCGKFHKLTAEEKKIPDMVPSVVLGVEVHDRILCPDQHPTGIMRSNWLPLDDFFIHETIVSAVIPRED